MNDRHETTPSEARDAQRWVAVFEAAVHAVITIDDRGRIEGFNRAAEGMFGYDRSEVISRNVKMLMPEPDHSQHDEYIRRYHRSGDRRIIGTGRHVVARHKEGRTFPIHLSVGEFEHESRRGYVGVIHDISAQVRAENQLRERDQMLRLTFHEAPLATATLDMDGKIVTANRVFSRLLGWEAEQARGRELAEFLHPEDRDPNPVPREVQERRCRLVDRQGQEHQVILHLNIVADPAGNPALLVAQFEDHTERLRAAAEARRHRERLAHVDRISRVGEMASGIAHEVNQPLSAIANYARALTRMMELRGIQDTDLTETANKLHFQAQRAGEIIRKMRQFVSRQPTTLIPLDVNRVVREVVALADMDGGARPGRWFRLELEPSLPAVVGDRIQLQQVVLNLLRNALEADPEGTIVVRTSRAGPSQVRIQVIDRGQGIDQQDESQLFDPFFTTKGDGMGLGLAISRSIIEGHGGRLDFRRNPDRGVTFTVQLLTGGEDSDDGS